MALELIAVDHRYGRHQSLQGVTMTVRPGDCYGFIGHNGAGKTTTLRIAMGLDRPQGGEVRVDGFSARRHPREARARTGGTIETTSFYGWVSARDNLVALARLQGLERRAARAEADRVLDEVGLAEHAGRRVGAFSQGMCQRLGIAQALLGGPRYVLLDEPHNGLDPEGVAELRAVLQRLTRDLDHGVLVSSHQLLEVAGMCNRVGVLRQGRLVLEEDTGQLLTSTRGRFVLGTDDVPGTGAVLDRLGVRYSRNGDEVGFELELGSGSPRDVVRELVAADVGVEQIAPRPVTLEEVYLRVAEAGDDAAATTTRATVSAATGTPTPELAPRWPAARVWLHDLRRHGRRWPVQLVVALPAVFAWRRVETLAAASERHLQAVAKGDLFSASAVTAFEALGRGITAGLPVLTLLAAAFGSQAIAGDLSLGTLRNMLLCPLRRRHVVLGKAMAVGAALLASLVLLVTTAALTAAARFDYGDLVEVYRDGETDVMVEAADVWPYVSETLLSTLLPVLAYAGVGFLIGVVVRRGVWSLAAALGAVFMIDLARAVARPLGCESLLLSAHQPSPLGDTSYLAFFTELAIGNAEAFYEFGNRIWAVPATWGAAAFSLAALLLAARRIP